MFIMHVTHEKLTYNILQMTVCTQAVVVGLFCWETDIK